MVVWRPSVARMVDLHTGTMGVHHACLFIVRMREVATPEARTSPENSFPVLRISPVPAHQLAGARDFLYGQSRRDWALARDCGREAIASTGQKVGLVLTG